MPARRNAAGSAGGGARAGTIVFSHANGFPAHTYRLLFEAWRAAGWRVEAIDALGHDADHPVTSNWPHVREQLVAFAAGLEAGPVHYVGHSLGGFLSLMAACARPALAAGVVLLDSPLIGGWRAHSLHVMKLTGVISRVSPGRVSRRRRYQWGSAAEARAHLSGKPAFASWDPRVLGDYVAGMRPAAGGGVQLAFDREVETRIYDSLPHNMGAMLRRHPPHCPVAFIGGTRSREVSQVGLALTRAVTRGDIHWIEGGHLFPMEQPAATAQAVLERLQAMVPSHDAPAR
jgi:pimeloyl-ACP methyl ester carboxylesterase